MIRVEYTENWDPVASYFNEKDGTYNLWSSHVHEKKVYFCRILIYRKIDTRIYEKNPQEVFIDRKKSGITLGG